MHCPECGSEVIIGAKTCSNCGYPVAAPDLDQKVQKIDKQWLMEELTGAGLGIKVVESDEDRFVIRRPGQMDVAVVVRGDLGLINFEHSWKVEPHIRENRVELLEAINTANRMSHFSTFYLDSKGTKLKAKSHIAFAEKLEIDVVRFLESLEKNFPQTIIASGLFNLLGGS